jgi:hypothetical protein
MGIKVRRTVLFGDGAIGAGECHIEIGAERGQGFSETGTRLARFPFSVHRPVNPDTTSIVDHT